MSGEADLGKVDVSNGVGVGCLHSAGDFLHVVDKDRVRCGFARGVPWQ